MLVIYCDFGLLLTFVIGGTISLEPLRPLVREGDGNARVGVALRGASVQLEKGAGARVSVIASSLTARSKLIYRLCISNFSPRLVFILHGR